MSLPQQPSLESEFAKMREHLNHAMAEINKILPPEDVLKTKQTAGDLETIANLRARNLVDSDFGQPNFPKLEQRVFSYLGSQNIFLNDMQVEKLERAVEYWVISQINVPISSQTFPRYLRKSLQLALSLPHTTTNVDFIINDRLSESLEEIINENRDSSNTPQGLTTRQLVQGIFSILEEYLPSIESANFGMSNPPPGSKAPPSKASSKTGSARRP